MNKTHLETFIESPFGNVIEKLFPLCERYDKSHDEIIPELVFDTIISSELSDITFLPRYRPEQKKFDLSLFQHIYYLWKDKNYFDISLALCNKLKETDLQDLDTFFLRTPYRSMYLSLPKGNGLYIPNDETGMHEAIGIYITFHDFKTQTQIKFGEQQKNIDGVTKFIRLMVAGEEKSKYNDAIIYFVLLFWEGKISDSIQKNHIHIDAKDLWPHIKEVFEFVSKVLIYINCSNVVIKEIPGFDLDTAVNRLKNPTKKRKLLHRYEKISTQKHKLLDIITINRNKEYISDSDNSISAKKGLERVRGHFKIQHFGINMSQKKIIWIEPYIRGEGAEEFKQHQYKVI